MLATTAAATASMRCRRFTVPPGSGVPQRRISRSRGAVTASIPRTGDPDREQTCTPRAPDGYSVGLSTESERNAMTARTGGETPEQAAGAQARRFVNESIADQAERFDSRRGEDGVVFQFLCECGRPTCRAVL